MSENNNLKFVICCCCNMYNIIYGFFMGLYNVYLKNILLYYNPLDMKMVFHKIKKNIDICNKFMTYDANKYEFIYKINKIDHKYGKFYNYGYYYHTSKLDMNYFKPEPEIAFPPEVVQSVLVTLTKSTDLDDSYTVILKDCVKHKFISHVLSYSSRESNLSILIYFYLQKYLKNYDIITNVELELDGNYYKVQHESSLGEIYDKLENEF